MELIADDLACRRAGRLVFEGVSFRLSAGRAAVLRGPNGAGKSSLLRLLAGLIPPAAGTARLDGIPLADAEAWREKVALGGHLDAVKPALTVRENLTAWAAFHARPEAAVEAALARFGLEGLAGDPAQWCSAGQKRRLGLARLLVTERPLWLLDEPTVSLDAASAEVLAAVVRAHVAEGGLALVATHVPLNLGAAEEILLPGRGAAPARPPTAATADPFLSDDWR